MSTNETKSGRATAGIGLVGLWTVLATVFHFAEFGAFAKWPVISWPWHWSCFCIAIWYCMLIMIAIAIIVAYYTRKTLKLKREKKAFDDEIEVRKLVVFGKIDEAEALAKKTWPNGIPEKIDTVLKAARSQHESNAT